MGRKNRSKRTPAPEDAPAFRVNPFESLEVDGLPPAPEPDEADPDVPVADPDTDLSPEDRDLLQAFGGGELEIPTAPANLPPSHAPTPSRGRVHLQMQKKGRGGKTVTRVLGLEDLDLAAEMDLAQRIRKALGTGTHFREGVLELQGDLRDRAAEWFETNGWCVR